MMFRDREDAGRRLGEALAALGPQGPVVFGIPRGGVIVASTVAQRIGAVLDVVVPAKIRAPFQPELGLGAVAEDGSTVLDEAAVRVLDVSEHYLEREIDERIAEIHRRTHLYRGDREPAAVSGRTAVVIDDGIATGWTAVCASRSVRKMGPSRLVLAVPVAPREAVGRLEAEVDEIVCLDTPEPFIAVGRWYHRFDQVTDEQVRHALQEVAR